MHKGQGQRLRRLRESKLVSQETAAHGIGVSVRAYRDWETGKGGISDENAPKVAAYFDTTTDFLRLGHELGEGTVIEGEDVLALIARNTERLERLEEVIDELAENLHSVRELTEGLVAAGVIDAVEKIRSASSLSMRQGPGTAAPAHHWQAG